MISVGHVEVKPSTARAKPGTGDRAVMLALARRSLAHFPPALKPKGHARITTGLQPAASPETNPPTIPEPLPNAAAGGKP